MIKEKIEEILISKLLARIKKKNINEFVISFMNKRWTFLKTEGSLLFHWYSSNKLFEIWSEDFDLLLSDITGLMNDDTYFKSLETAIKYHINKNGRKVSIKRHAHYEKSSLTLYVNTWNSKVIKIMSDKIEEVPNWTDWILFIQESDSTSWEFQKDLKETSSFIDNFLESINFSEKEIKKQEYVFLLKNYILSLFFASLLNNRPILIFVWEMGAGKSFFFETLLKILFGDKISLSNFPWKDDDLKAILRWNYINVFDNADSKINNNTKNLLCTVATGGAIKTRKLYTNKEVISTKVDTFMGITTMLPKFVRWDLIDRSILINLNRRTDNFGWTVESKEEISLNRNNIMTSLCLEIQHKLKDLEDYKNFKTNFRMSDFANFILNINKNKEEYVKWLLDKLIISQQKLVNSNDDLLIALKYLLDDFYDKNTSLSSNNNGSFCPWEFYTSSELHKILTIFKSSNPWLIKYESSSVKSLWKILNLKKEIYQKLWWVKIEVKSCASNIKKYAISKALK